MSDEYEERWDAVQEGAELLREGELEAALAELQRVADDDPENEYAQNYLGAVYFEQGEFMPAMKHYLRAIELKANYLGAMLGLGHCLRMLGRHDEAIKVGKQILHLQKDDADALHLMGMIYFARGDRNQALDYLERFLSTGPEAEVATEAQGILQMLRGEVIPLHEQDDHN
ncbi:MAG: tetratricopeptide repeat protein [Myxococcales bacterium]|nr:MAG: tetratricopeptide repeat protein [Myxococcales bacterium]